MYKILSAGCLLLAMFTIGAQAKPSFSVKGSTLDFNAPIVQDKTNLTNLAPAGQIVFENPSQTFFGLAPDGTWVNFGSTSNVPSQITVHNSSANGSTGVRVKVFNSTPTIETGTDIDYIPDGINGDMFKILTSGVYAISYSASASLLDYFAISRGNTTTALDLTLSTNLAAANTLARCSISAGNHVANCSWTGYLNANEVIRAHQDGTTSGTAALSTFTITRIN